jgi:hypothetical protein
MRWYQLLAHFFGGMFIVNGIPHFVSGVCGRKFPSPFASPPGKGLSSAMVNVLWGTLNGGVGYWLVWHIGWFDLRSGRAVVIAAAGGLVMAMMLARAFSQETVLRD